MPSFMFPSTLYKQYYIPRVNYILIICNHFFICVVLVYPNSWFITGFVTRLTRQVLLVDQELLTLLEHMSSPPVLSGVRVTRSLVLCVCFVDHCLSFVLFILAIVLPVLLRFTDFDYPFGIFNLFLISNLHC